MSAVQVEHKNLSTLGALLPHSTIHMAHNTTFSSNNLYCSLKHKPNNFYASWLFFFFFLFVVRAPSPVSYTHLDVYKRQIIQYSKLVERKFNNN